MSEEIYVVTLKSSDDLEGFYSDMKSDGFKLYQKRPMSKNTSYYMTQDQAKTISEDVRVRSVLGYPRKDDFQRLSYADHNMTSSQAAGNYRKNSAGDGWDFDWAKLHQAGTDAQRRKSPTVNSASGFWDAASSSTVPQVSDSNEFFGDGRHVDVIICDDAVPYDCGEFINQLGESWDTNGDVIPLGQSRVHQYDWFAELNQYVTSIDDDSQGTPGSNYTYYYDMANTPSGNYHGLHVAGTACGNHYGWAKKANIYSIDIFSTWNTSNYMGGLILFDYIRAFHRYKPINKLTGRRSPTVCNHSWGSVHAYLYQAVDSWIDPGDVAEVYWNGVNYTSSNPGPSGWTTEGLWADFGIDPSLGSPNNKPSRSRSDVDDDIKEQIKDGVVHIGAAGNEHAWQVPQRDPATGTTHISYGNWMKINGYSSYWPYTNYVMLNEGGSPNNSANDLSPGGRANVPINVGATGNSADNRPASFSCFGPKISTWAPGQNIISAFTDYGNPCPKYGANHFYDSISGTSMASPQVCGLAACLSSGKDRFTNSDLLGYLELYDKKDDMTFDVSPRGNNYILLDTVGGTDHFVISGQDAFQNHSNADDPPISIQVGDTLTFVHPGDEPSLYSASATAGSHYEVMYVDHTNMYSGGNTVANNPTLNIEVGDILSVTIYIGTTGGTTYIKTSPSTGTGDLVTAGTFEPQNGWYISNGSWDTTGVTPGTYYYQDSADAACGGQIVVHAAGTYYNHPLHIQNTNVVGDPVVAHGTVTNNGGSNRRSNPQWNTQGVPEGTYYYVHGTNANAWGEIIVTNKLGVLGQAGNFSDNTAQKDSPNSEMMAVNPRGTGYLGGWNKATLKGFRRWDEFNTGRDIQVFPRTNGLYTTKPGGLNHIYDVTAAGGLYVMTGSDRMDVYDAKQNPTITIRTGDVLTLNVNASGHPLWIGISQQTGTVTWQNAMGTINNNGATSGTITWDTTNALPGTYYYNCEYHGTMTGTIFVNEP